MSKRSSDARVCHTRHGAAAALAAVYPTLCRHAIEHLHSPDVLRCLGRQHAGKQQVTSDLKRRVEGLRVKHHVGANSIKMYDKQQRVLRIETTLNDPSKFRVWRRAEHEDNTASSGPTA